MHRHHALGSAAVLGVLVVLSLIAVSVARHPGSIRDAGSGLLMVDVALLVAYGVAGTWVWRQRRPEVAVAPSAGAQVGLTEHPRKCTAVAVAQVNLAVIEGAPVPRVWHGCRLALTSQREKEAVSWELVGIDTSQADERSLLDNHPRGLRPAPSPLAVAGVAQSCD